MKNDTVKIIKTTTWSPGPGCHGGCGILVHVKDEKVIKVEGDPDVRKKQTFSPSLGTSH